jgi:hypothetical protein
MRREEMTLALSCFQIPYQIRPNEIRLPMEYCTELKRTLLKIDDTVVPTDKN